MLGRGDSVALLGVAVGHVKLNRLLWRRELNARTCMRIPFRHLIPPPISLPPEAPPATQHRQRSGAPSVGRGLPPRRRAGRPQCSVSQSVSYFTVPPRAHPSACPIILDRSGDVSARAHTCVASPALNPALRRAPVLTQVLGPRLFHGPAPRSHLRRLSVRLRRSRSNTSTAYRVLAPTGLLNYRK